MIEISLQGFINGNGIPQVNINKAQVAPTPTTHNPQSTAAAWDDKHQHYHNVLANGKIEGHMIECYLQVASRNISDPCVASREGSKKDRKVCHKSSCLLLLSFSLDFNCWYRIFVLVLDTGLCPDYLDIYHYLKQIAIWSFKLKNMLLVRLCR